MTTPLREVEYVLGLALMGLLKLAAAMVTVSIAALVFYRFGLGEIGWGLVPVIGVLMLCGWCTAMLVIGLLLRYGQSAEILAWATTFVLLALSGVFNPVESLPGAIQPIAKVLPTTYAFRAARDLLDGGPIPWSDLLLATISAFVLAGLSMLYVLRMLRRVPRPRLRHALLLSLRSVAGPAGCRRRLRFATPPEAHRRPS